MILLLVLVHLLNKNGTAVPVTIPLAPRSSTANSCDDINNCRKLFDIVWGCLVTIFTCTWASVHPNVPPPGQSWLALFLHRLKMMLIGIIAPELMVGFAVRQFWGVRILAKEYGFSRTHGFFFCMGGFVSSTGYPVVTRKQLEDMEHGPEFLKAIKYVNAEDIADKSKGDALSKGVALAQGLWFTTQCFARLHQRLAITELEFATLAFAVVNILIWLLWWDKPLDVQRPMVVGPSLPLGPHWGYNYYPLLSTSVPSFWSFPMGKNFQLATVGVTALAGSVFGAIHCAAWTLEFSTAAEMWIWRSCSLVITAFPGVCFLASLAAFIASHWQMILGTSSENAIVTVSAIGFFGSFPIYIAARLILVVLSLS
ncbi:hypothetical protein MVEN_00931400 [Mycena venus]|uniref:Uncharacterized protein n=1 Tax=Mycena venus TaxID=2733690 RepID=A0A8H7CZJ9_9AGAR|nr:hypothetical protein MVEN_00931400 [Mycena venus]